MPVHPYLYFNGCCEEALEFYKKTLGATVEMMMRFSESPDPSMCMPEIPGEKIMHTSFQIRGSTIMGSDGRCEGKTKFEGFSLSIPAADEQEAQRLFEALSEGGQVQMPLMKTFYSPAFGMVTDRFGVSWMVIVPA